MKTETNLKPCPFCGGEVKIIGIEDCGDYSHGAFKRYFTPECQNENCIAYCLDCYFETREEAVEAWNHRASPWRTDEPPKDGERFLVRLRSGVMVIVAWGTWRILGGNSSQVGWGIVGGGYAYSGEPNMWMEIPR